MVPIDLGLFLLIFFSNATQSEGNFHFDLLCLTDKGTPLLQYRVSVRVTQSAPCPVIPRQEWAPVYTNLQKSTEAISWWSGPRPRWLSKEMSTPHPVLHKRIQLRPAHRCVLQSFPTQESQDVEIREWNMLPAHIKLLWSRIHSVDH